MPRYVICTEAMDQRVTFNGTLAAARTRAQTLANAWSVAAKIVFADNPPTTNDLVQANVNLDAKVERFTPAGISPTFTSLTPATGPAAGGTVVVFVGGRVDIGATFTIGGVAVANLVRLSNESYRFTTTAQAAAALPLVITNPDATTITVANAYTYT